jgi:predicted house-cleaning noncanonical NTP pyrophosphatase (MazG superfamily)
MNAAHATNALLEEHHRAHVRQRLLEDVKEALRDGRVVDAVDDLIRVVEMLSDSEERVMRLHAECVAILEHGQKILALDQSLRPVIIKIEPHRCGRLHACLGCEDCKPPPPSEGTEG